MSGAQTSTFGNVLFNAPAAYQAAQTYKDNELLMQQHQQQIGAADTEMAARIAGSLLTLPDEQARAAAYPTYLAQARANNYRLPHAPETYPGEAALRVTAQMGTPSADLYKLGLDRTAKGAIAPGDGGTTAATGGGGGGTGTVGGADTAPINAAGDSRTRKAAEGGPPAAGSPGAAVAKQVHDFWISKGFSEEQTAGIMGGGPGSESDFTPTVFGDKGTSYGLYQHHGPRLDAMRQFFGLSSSQNPTADQQNQYAHWEITQGPLKNVGEMLKTAKTAAEAAAIWTQYFGVPADKSEIGRRAAGAHRFVGLYGQPQQGGPGGATAAAPPPGVQMGGAVPPPPGGAPGAYPAYGGGVGAVVGQGVRPNIGGPQLTVAPPPVIRAQPIPGTASNADVIMGGVRQAQATPLAGTQVAGPPMVASTQPTAAVPAPPVETPTPARYAGNAPAPSVEAAPETGWGSQVGSGYGPQNALAPPPPQPPARPATPAQPAAAQPPAADTLPPLPAPTPPEPRNNNRLTAAQQHDIDTQRNTSISAKDLQARVDAYRTANDARAEKFQADQLAYAAAVQTRRHTGVEEQRQAAADKLAAEKAAREAADAAKLQLSKSDEADAERVLFAIAPKVRRGEELTEAEADQYDVARRRYARGPLQQVPDGKGGTITAFVGQDVPDRFPPLPGQKEYAGLKPIPGTERQAAPPPQQVVGGILTNADGQAKIMQALSELKKYPGGVGLVAGGQPSAMSQWTDPGGVAVRAAIGRVEAHEFHTLTGASQTASEAGRLKPFVASAQDTKDAIETKLTQALELVRSTNLRAYRAYGPEVGGLRLPVVEEAILATIPRDAIDLMRANPDQEHKSDFDKKYGKGTAKMALDND